MANRIQLRRDTAANWTRVNPVLEDGEPGLEIDTKQIKYGDGNTSWMDLAYASGGLTDVDGVVAFPGDLLIGTLWPNDPMPMGDKESVVWAKDDTEYLGLWWGGSQTYPESGYGPVAGIMIGAYDSMTDDFTGNASPVDTTITIAINNSLGNTLEWVFDRDGILKMPPGDHSTPQGWIEWSVDGNQPANIVAAGFVDYYNVYTGLGLTAPRDTNANKGIWFGTPLDPNSPFQPETSMLFKNDTLYLPKNGYIKSHDISSGPQLTTIGTNVTIQTHNLYNITNITSGGTNYNSGSGTVTTGGSGTGMTVNINQAGGVVDIVIVNNPGSGYHNGDTMTILTGDSNATFTISNYNTLGNDLTHDWRFDAGGDLTLPPNGDILINGGANSAIRDLIQHDVHTGAANYSLVLSDRGKMIYQTGGYTVIVPTNGQVAFPIGSVITIVNSGGAGDLDIVSFDVGVNTDIYGAGTDITSTDWALPSNSIATLIKVATSGAYSKWLLSGVGIYDNS